MNGFIVTLPSSVGIPCFFVTPERIGQRYHHHYPWGRATFVATVFPTREDAQAALDRMTGIHRYIAPELNGGLTRRLYEARVIGVDQVAGIELDRV